MSDQQEQLRRERRRAEGLAVVAAIVLHELERDGRVWPHTRELLASAVAAYEAGKESLTTTPADVERQMSNAMEMIQRARRLSAGPGEESNES